MNFSLDILLSLQTSHFWLILLVVLVPATVKEQSKRVVLANPTLSARDNQTVATRRMTTKARRVAGRASYAHRTPAWIVSRHTKPDTRSSSAIWFSGDFGSDSNMGKVWKDRSAIYTPLNPTALSKPDADVNVKER